MTILYPLRRNSQTANPVARIFMRSQHRWVENITLHRKFHLLVLVNIHIKYFEPSFNPNNMSLFHRSSELAQSSVTHQWQSSRPRPPWLCQPSSLCQPRWRTETLACSLTPPGDSSCANLEMTSEGLELEQRFLTGALGTFPFPMSWYHLAEKLLAAAVMWLCPNFCARYKMLVTASLFPFLWGLVKTQWFELNNRYFPFGSKNL